MKEEIAAAVFFVARLAKRYGCLDNYGRDRFAAALTSVLFESYKNHWDPYIPVKGQGYRCLRMNKVQLKDPVLEQACVRSDINYEDLGLPKELTLWVDPGEVSCRYGEHSSPFCVSLVDSCRRGDGEFSRRIQLAVERASDDIQSGASSDEEGGDTSMSSSSSQSALCQALAHTNRSNPELKPIPTVSNPNSVYQFSEFSSGAPLTWVTYPKRKVFPVDGFLPHIPQPTGQNFQFSGQKSFKPYRPSFSFTGPRVDKYHWVNKTRS